ncbi:hypothetical protein HHK36_007952 [Tetracentron sinense]|uniref:RING-type domain-containing protein n=1 Tax=Tetracentron sinense TaxID=13715 RepID=A0A835DMY5_TETSI|nr:hypothetical protein HHK36_007952 [Tetracentron sinense]
MSPSTPHMFQDFLGNVHSRRLLLHTPLYQSPDTAAPPVNNHDTSEIFNMDKNSFDANVVLIVIVLLCGIICALGLNSTIRCALRCSTRVSSEPESASESGNNSTKIANTGLMREVLKTFPVLTYSAELKVANTECVICLSEFAPGELIRVLPKCNHGFHVQCIDKWLTSHFSCPTCRNCLIVPCQKIVGSDQVSTSESPLPLPLPGSTVPLEPEGLEPNYRRNC